MLHLWLSWSFPEGLSLKGGALWGSESLATTSSAPIIKSNIPKEGMGHNHLYALSTHQDSEDSANIVTSMLWIFSRDINMLLDPGSTMFYVIHPYR